jgi:hypothetical protein
MSRVMVRRVSLSDALSNLRGTSSMEAVGRDGERVVALRVGRDWRVAFRLVRDAAEGWRVTEFAAAHDGGLSGMDPLRRLPLGQLLAQARQLAGDPLPTGSALVSLRGNNLASFLREGRGRGRRPDLDYARLALEYVLLVQDGCTSPAREMSRRAGRGSVQVWTDRLTEARRRGLLSDPSPGVAGGELTEKAHALLFGDDPA